MLTQRILLSLAVIVAVGGAAVASTGAFFSDTETSTGNSFTAGAIDLTVDSTSHYNNTICLNGTWQLASSSQLALDQYPVIGTSCDGTWTNPINLGPTTKFFNFGDVKPGDQGEDTVSLHVDNNPSWACVNIKTTSNEENGINGPEAAAGDVTSGSGQGELAQNTQVYAWLDNGAGGGVAGDNIWQAGEPKLDGPVTLSSFINGTTTLALADSATNGGAPLPPGQTNYVGLYWCAGTIHSTGPGNLSCDGTTMGNNTQTDSATADVSFNIVQSRNNSSFRCNPLIQ
jgi:predicted ribosomally synthesized peptide with SipW-like signal peptide